MRKKSAKNRFRGRTDEVSKDGNFRFIFDSTALPTSRHCAVYEENENFCFGCGSSKKEAARKCKEEIERVISSLKERVAFLAGMIANPETGNGVKA